MTGIAKFERVSYEQFLPFGITTDDKASAERKGGFGSSGK